MYPERVTRRDVIDRRIERKLRAVTDCVVRNPGER